MANVRADTREVVTRTMAGETTVTTFYQQGERTRFEQSGSAVVTISASDGQVAYRVDMQSRQYGKISQTGSRWLASLAQLD